MFGPSTTPDGAPPTRSATAARAPETSCSARAEEANTPPRSAIGTRIAWDTARTTLSGTSAPPGPSACTSPSDSPGKSPRTRATSSTRAPDDMSRAYPVAQAGRRERRGTPPTLARPGDHGGMTAPGAGEQRPQQVLVVGPDGQPVGAL